MQIFVRTLTGKTITVEVDESTEIAQVRAQVEAKTGVPSVEQRLTNAGRQLSDTIASSDRYDRLNWNSALRRLRRKSYAPRGGIVRKKRNIATISFYKISREDTLHLTTRLLGCKSCSTCK